MERALKNLQYPGFGDFLDDIQRLQILYENNGPPGPASLRKTILLEFCLKAVSESADWFLGTIRSELTMQRTIAEENKRKLDNEI